MTDYRQVGGQMGAYIRANNPSTHQIQALVADLLAGDELFITMREVVGCSSFSPLKPLAGTGTGAVQRDALLQELSQRYLPQVVEEVGRLLDGMLDLSPPSGMRPDIIQEQPKLFSAGKAAWDSYPAQPTDKASSKRDTDVFLAMALFMLVASAWLFAAIHLSPLTLGIGLVLYFVGRFLFRR